MAQQILFKVICPIITGAILTLAFAPFSYWWIACATMAIWMYLSQKFPGFLTGFLFGLGLFGSGVSWISVSMMEYGGASILLAMVMTGIFVAGLAIFPGLASLGYALWSSRWPTATGQVILLTACWVTMEAFRSWFLTGFPWLLLGYSAIDSPFSGYLSWVGTYGVSCIIALTGGCFVVAIQTKNIFSLIVAMTLASVGLGLDAIYLPTQQKDESVSVALWQPVIPQQIKWKQEHRSDIVARHVTKGLPNQASLIIWPETALPMTETNMWAALPDLDLILANNDQTLITGVLGESRGRFTNRLVSLGVGSGIYDKARLVPFGEYVPFELALRGLIDFFNLPMSQLVAGQRNDRLLHKTLRIAPLICYEIAYAGRARRNANDANVLLTVSNDTWFGSSIGPDQHLEIAQIRARELGKPVIRATNDGLTALINPYGQITQQLKRFTREVLYGVVIPSSEVTPYSKAGETPLIMILVVLLTLTRQNGVQK